MIEPHPRSLSHKALLIWVSVGCAVTVALLLINLTLLWFSGQELAEGVRIFYWQQFDDYLSWLQCLSLLLAPVTIAIWATIGIRRLRMRQFSVALAVGLLLLCACAFTNYSAFFALSSVDHIGTVALKGSFYHLAKITKYDDESLYYLGRCDQTGYWCSFHKIYRIDLFQIDIPDMRLSDDAQHLIVKVNGDTVYTFDGVREYCIDGEDGKCAQNLR